MVKPGLGSFFFTTSHDIWLKMCPRLILSKHPPPFDEGGGMLLVITMSALRFLPIPYERSFFVGRGVLSFLESLYETDGIFVNCRLVNILLGCHMS